jgi:hypothetical protein
MTTKPRAGASAKPAPTGPDDGDPVAKHDDQADAGTDSKAYTDVPEHFAFATDSDVKGSEKRDDGPPSEAELDARERELALRERELALEARERELVAREQSASAELAAVQGVPGLPEFLLTLANGDTIEAANPNASHHAAADGTLWPVVRAYPIPGKYGVPYATHPDNPDRQQRQAS